MTSNTEKEKTLNQAEESTDVDDEKQIKLTRTGLKIVNAGAAISEKKPGSNEMVFMHAVMCQIALPRSKTDDLDFERKCGDAGISVKAGKLWNGKKFVQQHIPYGPTPRLILLYLNTLALRQKSPIVDVGKSASDFLKKIGRGTAGGECHKTLHRHISALSACSITFGLTKGGNAITFNGQPIHAFEKPIADEDTKEDTKWPRYITFSQEYYDTLKNHAVPLDLRAILALSTSALALDLYIMLADRLHRIKNQKTLLNWIKVREQFGQEYTGDSADKNFKKAFKPALNRVKTVYPHAKVEIANLGMYMYESPPAVDYKKTPFGEEWHVDKII